MGTDVRKGLSDGSNTSNTLFNTLTLFSREMDTASLLRNPVGKDEKSGVCKSRRTTPEEPSPAIPRFRSHAMRSFMYMVASIPPPSKNNATKTAFLIPCGSLFLMPLLPFNCLSYDALPSYHDLHERYTISMEYSQLPLAGCSGIQISPKKPVVGRLPLGYRSESKFFPPIERRYGGSRGQDMKVTFLGTNGWYDTETGNTVCTLVQTKGYDIIFDAGNGIHKVDRYVDWTRPAFLFLGHFHVDHIAGLHILAKFRFAKRLTICGPTGCRETLGTFLKAPFTIPLSWLSYPARILEMPAEQDSLPFPVEALPLRHSSLTMGYRIEIDGRTIAYCSDTGYCENAVTLGRSADLLITECAYKEGQSREEWPHLNPEMAARIAREAGARRLALTHFDAEVYRTLPERKASEAVAARTFAATTAGIDGLQIEI